MNKYLEKIAADHMLRGYISPAWQENTIAREHGQEGLKGFKDNAKKYLTGLGRTAGRAALEGGVGSLAGGAAGLGLSKLVKNRMPITSLLAPYIGGSLGGFTGGIHGGYKSLKNQAAEAHAKYSTEKQAALNQLIEAGVDFDQAVTLVNNKAKELYRE